jgi:predicted O-linked N-acetylglucosamine transferase (SPINDLY family)
VDYWIGGRDTEDADRAREHYSERLVLIPGCGQAPVPITHPPTYPILPPSPVVIGCSWAGQKINDDHLQRLAEIGRRARTPVRFKFFPGGSVLENRLIPLRKSIAAVLGEDRVQVFGAIDYTRYMTELEAIHFALDAHPFGGYNTGVDLLTLRRPIVTLEGNRFYNRSTAYLLRRIGLDELITSTPEEYVDVGVQMIDDAAFRDRMVRRLKTANLDKTVLSLEHVPAFVRAIDYMLDNHERLVGEGSREPLLID